MSYSDPQYAAVPYNQAHYLPTLPPPLSRADTDSSASLSPVLSKAKGRQRDATDDMIDGGSGDADETFSYDAEDGEHCTTSSNEDEHAALISQALNPDGTPKRPMNAFLLYAKKRRPEISVEQPTMRTGEISKVLSREWSSMSKADKQFFLDQAKRLKDNFNARWPDYVYRRRPNNTKKRRKNSSAIASPICPDDEGNLHSRIHDDLRYTDVSGSISSSGDHRRHSPSQPALTRLAPAMINSDIHDARAHYLAYPPPYPRPPSSSTPTSSQEYTQQFGYSEQPEYPSYTYYSAQPAPHGHGASHWSFDGTTASSSSSSDASPGAHAPRSLASHSQPQSQSQQPIAALYHAQEMHGSLHHHHSQGSLGIDVNAPSRADPSSWDNNPVAAPVSAGPVPNANAAAHGKQWGGFANPALMPPSSASPQLGRARRGTYPLPNSGSEHHPHHPHTQSPLSSLQHAVPGVVSTSPHPHSHSAHPSPGPLANLTSVPTLDHPEGHRQRPRQWSTSSGSSASVGAQPTNTSLTRSANAPSHPNSDVNMHSNETSPEPTAEYQFQALSAPFYPAQNNSSSSAGMTGGPVAPAGQTGLSQSQSQSSPTPNGGNGAQGYYQPFGQELRHAGAMQSYGDSSPLNTTPPISTPPTPGYALSSHPHQGNTGGYVGGTHHQGQSQPSLRNGIGIPYSVSPVSAVGGGIGAIGEYAASGGAHPGIGVSIGLHGHGGHPPNLPNAYWERVKSDST